jgi:hypothetical protein
MGEFGDHKRTRGVLASHALQLLLLTAVLPTGSLLTASPRGLKWDWTIVPVARQRRESSARERPTRHLISHDDESVSAGF